MKSLYHIFSFEPILLKWQHFSNVNQQLSCQQKIVKNKSPKGRRE
jgi:hypothetical protein